MTRLTTSLLLAAFGISTTNAFRRATLDIESNRTSTEDETTLGNFKVLQWNPHWECFKDSNMGTCGHHAMGALSSILPELHIDFANVIEINERSDFYTPPAPFRMLNARCGHPVIDSTSIIYDSSAWTPVSDFVQGCMHHHDRPFGVQTFRSTSSSEKVIFVGAHFPHSASNGHLKRAVEAETHRHPDALGVVFAADVNREHSISTESVMLWDVHGAAKTAGSAANGRITSAQREPSCCKNDGFVHHYDRVSANFAHRVATQMLFDPAPWWTNIPRSSFHKAILATFHL